MDKSKIARSLKRFFSFRGLSIQQRLPLLICVLLLGMIATFGLISYLQVRKSALHAGSKKLQSVQSFVDLVTQTSQGLINQARYSASQPALLEYLEKKDSASRVAALLALQSKDTSSVVLTELLDNDLHAWIHIKKPTLDWRVNYLELEGKHRPDTGITGKIYRAGDGIMYFPVIVAVTGKSGIEGYLIKWRKMTNSARAMTTLIMPDLDPDEVNVYIGNSDNSFWTDMSKPVNYPVPANAELKDSALFYTSMTGEKVVASQIPIRTSKWVLLVELDERSLLAPARSFLNDAILIGGGLIIIGMFLAWLMSRNITRPLNQLTATATAIASGDDSDASGINRRDEVGKLARAFNAMIAQVSKANKKLGMKVVESELMNEQLRELSAHLQHIREEERMHIAREMHDELGQFLTGLKMDIAWLNKKLAPDPANGANREKLGEMTKLVDEAVVFVRRLAAELRPSILDDLGLVAALEWHSREFNRRFNIDVDFIAENPELKTSEAIATGLFRMYQESLTNVARHAEAQHVTAILKLINNEIHLSVTDDGKGFDTNGKRKTLGLLGMKERAMMIGGQLEITSEPGKGTTVYITVPLEKKALKLLMND
ncbi:MAG TPA: histidine kinase [Chitinophagaceae bacterium]|jgi:signal transduction histidine kinase|nr:histidine kinase [Chitinophagaceae bacterium]